MSPFLSSPTSGQRPGSASSADGSEFGLIPKHILRNKQQMKLAKNNSKMMKQQQQQQQENGGDYYSTASTTTTSTTINSNNNSSSIAVKDCPSPSNTNGESTKIPPTEEEMKDILKEINKVLDSQPPWNAHYKFVTKTLLKSSSPDDAIYNLDQEKKLLITTEQYNIKDSAKRINQHYHTKYDWFGKQSQDKSNGDTVLKLTSMDQPILIKDLLLHQRILLESGYIQLLPTRDLAGRAIIFGNFDTELYKRHTLQFNQILYYIIHTALEDYETCMKGIVLVVWNNNSSNNATSLSSPTSVVEKLGLGSIGVGGYDPFLQAWNNQSLPGIRHAYKISKLHYCCARTAASNGTEPYTVVEKREHNIDMRIHKGSLQECLHGLVTYGIPSHLLPLLDVSSTTTTTTAGVVGKKNDNDNNNKSDDGFMKWIDLRRRMESINSMMLPIDQNNSNKKDVGGGVVTPSSTTTNGGGSIVLVPNRMDVLFGSNKTQQRKMTLQGNIIFHQLVHDNMEAYHDIEIDDDGEEDNNNDSHDDDDVKKEGICLTIWHSIIIQNNGRFLQQIEEGQMWEALSKKQALVKISQALAFMCSQYYDDDDEDESSSAANNANQSNNDNNKLAKKKRKNGGLFGGDDPFDLTDIFSGVTQCWNSVQGFNNGDNKCW